MQPLHVSPRSTMTPKTVLLTLDSRGYGGIETHISHLAAGLQAHGVNVTLALLADYGAHPLEKQLSASGVPTVKLRRGLRELIQLLKSTSADVLHTHGYKAGVMGRLAGAATGAPCVSTFHNGDRGAGKLWLYTLIDKVSAGLSTNICVSRDIQQRLRPWASELVNNFIDAPKLDLPPESEQNRVLFVGRLEQEKGPSLFLDIAARLPETEFHMYGSGSLESSLRAQAPDNLTLHGCEPDQQKIWRDADALLITSNTEGLPYAALEAMSRGVAVFSTAVGDLPQLIDHGENGFICAGAADAFANAIERWRLQTPNERRCLRIAAANRVAHQYSAAACIPKLLTIYEKACAV
ncbi:glycosyltransferase family 4 protein [Hahella aquimaris]|uniref:glycosyltransferase family 4 protein n=1 Tax=Hahella sp. HNIBRBA332 TaxID=3015983 RepID=UPI00273CF462|nr:glycosyltransferase family 4 protein [Hahella sp. HNIBRBA332]WLQ16641.1 glycosyltransferase family 4 protein [Hahella sp. HNIBRBA332]